MLVSKQVKQEVFTVKWLGGEVAYREVFIDTSKASAIDFATDLVGTHKDMGWEKLEDKAEWISGKEKIVVTRKVVLTLAKTKKEKEIDKILEECASLEANQPKGYKGKIRSNLAKIRKIDEHYFETIKPASR